MARSKDELDKREMALLYILEMFEAYTDEDHPKTYKAVMEMLEDERVCGLCELDSDHHTVRTDLSSDRLETVSGGTAIW